MTTVSLKERITEDMKAAMRASDKERLSTIRMLQAAIKQREVDERVTLDDAQVLAVIEKMVKQRKESIAQFEQGGRARPRRQGKVRDRAAAGVPAGPALRSRSRCAHPGSHRRPPVPRPSRTWAR
jgi:excinuclease UvrABC nuclease subunit